MGGRERKKKERKRDEKNEEENRERSQRSFFPLLSDIFTLRPLRVSSSLLFRHSFAKKKKEKKERRVENGGEKKKIEILLVFSFPFMQYFLL